MDLLFQSFRIGVHHSDGVSELSLGSLRSPGAGIGSVGSGPILNRRYRLASPLIIQSFRDKNIEVHPDTLTNSDLTNPSHLSHPSHPHHPAHPALPTPNHFQQSEIRPTTPSSPSTTSSPSSPSSSPASLSLPSSSSIFSETPTKRVFEAIFPEEGKY